MNKNFKYLKKILCKNYFALFVLNDCAGEYHLSTKDYLLLYLFFTENTYSTNEAKYRNLYISVKKKK